MTWEISIRSDRPGESQVLEASAPGKAKRLVCGESIGSTSGTWSGGESFFYLQMSSGSGQFYDLRGFIGVRFLIGSYLHYGWIDYSGTGSGEGTIHGWAYETTPYAAITACAPRCFLAPIQMLLLSP